MYSGRRLIDDDGGSFFSDFGLFLVYGNWSFQRMEAKEPEAHDKLWRIFKIKNVNFYTNLNFLHNN